MQFILGMPTNIIEVVFVLLVWGLLITIMYHVYQKQEVKPKVWKASVTVLIGLFTLTLNIPFYHRIIEIPLVPLGVWILFWYAKSRSGAWSKYRRFAWLGFSVNFIFIVATIASVLLHHVVFPKANLSTYIATYEHAEIVQLHPSAKRVIFDIDRFEQQYPFFKEEPFNGIEWYNNMFSTESNKREERFPYQLKGISSKRGSGIPVLIYVERDGKGLLVDSMDKQRYFRSNESILKGGYSE